MQFIIKKFFIIIIFITSLAFHSNLRSNTLTDNIDDYGIISIMYHRFEENKYPSTNIKIKDLSIYYQFVLYRRISREGMERLLKKYQRRTGNLLTMMILFKSLILIRNLQHRQRPGRGKLPRFLSIHVLRRCSRFTRSSRPKQGQSSMSTQTQSSNYEL